MEMYYPCTAAFDLTKLFWCYSLKKLILNALAFKGSLFHLVFPSFHCFFNFIFQTHTVTWLHQKRPALKEPYVLHGYQPDFVSSAKTTVMSESSLCSRASQSSCDSSVSEICHVWRLCRRCWGHQQTANLAVLWNEANTPAWSHVQRSIIRVEGEVVWCSSLTLFPPLLKGRWCRGRVVIYQVWARKLL